MRTRTKLERPRTWEFRRLSETRWERAKEEAALGFVTEEQKRLHRERQFILGENYIQEKKSVSDD